MKSIFRRRRKGLTNYRKRLAILKGALRRNIPFAAIRRTNTRFIVQFTEFDENGDKVLLTITSDKVMKDLGLALNPKNVQAAYITGYYAGIKAQEKGIKEVIPYLNVKPTKGGRLISLLKGLKDSGIEFNFSEDLVDEARIKGEHLKNPVNIDEIKKKIRGG